MFRVAAIDVKLGFVVTGLAGIVHSLRRDAHFLMDCHKADAVHVDGVTDEYMIVTAVL